MAGSSGVRSAGGAGGGADRFEALRARALRIAAPLALVAVLAMVVLPVYVTEPGDVAAAAIDDELLRGDFDFVCTQGPGSSRPGLLDVSAEVRWECGLAAPRAVVSLRRTAFGWRVTEIWFEVGGGGGIEG